MVHALLSSQISFIKPKFKDKVNDFKVTTTGDSIPCVTALVICCLPPSCGSCSAYMEGRLPPALCSCQACQMQVCPVLCHLTQPSAGPAALEAPEAHSQTLL